MEELTHIDASGRPRMVDVTRKPDTQREAVAKCLVRMKASTLERLKKGNMPKGDVLAVAQLAGIMAAKQTPHIIPLCAIQFSSEMLRLSLVWMRRIAQWRLPLR